MTYIGTVEEKMMPQIKRLTTLISALILTTLSSVASAQTNCLTVPANIEWSCGALDWSYVYSNLGGAEVHECINPLNILPLPIALSVIVDTLACGNISAPNVVIRITRNFTADSGNLLDTGCGPGLVCGTQIIDITDYEAPTFTTFPADSTVSCENWDLLDYLISGVFAVDFQDNCGLVDQIINLDTVSGGCSAEQQFYWEFKLTDGCNNTFIDTHVVNVVDIVGPLITFIPPQIIQPPLECKDDVVWPLIQAFDLCSQVDTTWWGPIVEDSLSCPNHYDLSRMAFAIDDCGNVDSSLFSVQVHDTIAPIFDFIPIELSVLCDETPVFENATASDGCIGAVDISVVMDTILSGLCSADYTLRRTFTATDVCMNTQTAEQLIIVSDLIPPLIFPPSGFTVECGETINYAGATSIDNCDPNPTISFFTDTINVTAAGTYTIIRTFNSTDACGNSNSSDQIINVIDATPPFFTTFPADITLGCGEDYPNDQASYEDYCDPNAYLLSYLPEFDFKDCASETVIRRTFIISDDSGNLTDSTQTITFLDTVPPVLITQLDSLFYQCAYEVPDCVDTFNGMEFEDCSMGSVTYVGCEDIVVSGICEQQECVIERTYFYEDPCGNQGSASQLIRIAESVFKPIMPSGMTPNNDGFNDSFVILDIGPLTNSNPGEVPCNWVPDTKFRVINRWGQLVFEDYDYRNDWKGTNKSGEDLPPGTYFVVFEAQGEVFSTYVDLRR